MSEEWVRKAVDQFITNEIDSVPHLEALLLLWNTRPRQWPVDEMAKALYVPPDRAQRIMEDLARRGLIATQTEPERYSYVPQPEEAEALMSSVEEVYRRELVRISRMIHGKAPSAVREFARAFRFTKEKDSDTE